MTICLDPDLIQRQGKLLEETLRFTLHYPRRNTSTGITLLFLQTTIKGFCDQVKPDA